MTHFTASNSILSLEDHTCTMKPWNVLRRDPKSLDGQIFDPGVRFL